MIAFSAPVGTSQVEIAGSTFDPATGILLLPPDLAEQLNDELVAIGFVNLGSTTMIYPRVVPGVIAASGSSDPILGIGTINISVWAVDPAHPVTATFTVERSFDAGDTWLPLTALDQPVALIGAFSTSFSEAENGVLYRLTCPNFIGGNANYRLSHS